MANTAVSNLTLLAGADIAQTDNLYIVDVSAPAGSRGKKTTVQDLAVAIAGGSYQPSDPQLDSLAGLVYAGNELKNVRVNAAGTGFELAATASGFDGSFASLTDVPTTLAGYGILDAQPLDTTLTNLAAQNWALNSVPVGTGVDTVSQVLLDTNRILGRSSTGNVAGKTVTDFAFTLLDDADAASMRTTLGVDPAGSSTLTAANEASDSTCFPLFATSATGTVTLKTNASLTFNSATANLGCTTFTGALAGNASTATLASTVTTNANLTGDVTSVGNATTIGTGKVTLAMQADLAQDQFIGRTSASTGVPQTATITAAARTVLDDATVGDMLSTLGGQPLDGDLSALAALSGTDTIYYRSGTSTWTAVTIGGNLSFSGGTLNANAAGVPTTITVADTTDSTCWVLLSQDQTGDIGPKTDGGLTYNASTGTLTATVFSGPLTGNVTGTASGNATTGAVTGSGLTMATARLLGRTTASSGAIEEMTVGTGLSLSGGSLTATATNCFAAHKNGTDQTGVVPATFTKVTFTTESFDVGGYYDNTNSKWTPPAGKVAMYAAVCNDGANSASGDFMLAAIYKNGSQFFGQPGGQVSTSGEQTYSVFLEDDANGTDYYEVYVFFSLSGGNKTIKGATNRTRFQGYTL